MVLPTYPLATVPSAPVWFTFQGMRGGIRTRTSPGLSWEQSTYLQLHSHVRKGGIEPPKPKPSGSEPGAFTYFTTRACGKRELNPRLGLGKPTFYH
jgi:hypothetical protein